MSTAPGLRQGSEMAEGLGCPLYPCSVGTEGRGEKRGQSIMKARFEFSLMILFGLIFFLSTSSYMSAPRFMQEENSPPPEDSFNHDQKAKMEKARRDEAFQKLKDGSQQLYKATGELKEMIEKSNEHTFSIQILKKIDEVEKMLKDVKRRAKEGF